MGTMIPTSNLDQMNEVILKGCMNAWERKGEKTRKSQKALDLLRPYEDEVPVDILDFIDSPDYLNLGDYVFDSVRKILDLYYNPQKHIEEFRPYYTEAELNDLYFQDLVLFIGQRTLKTVTSAIITLYEIYKLLCLPNPQAHYELAPGTPIKFSAVATSAEQAQDTVFEYVKQWRDGSPWFQRYMSKSLDLGVFKIHEANFYWTHKNIICESTHSRSSGLRGMTRLGFVIDEIAHFEETAGARGVDKVYAALLASTRTFNEHAKRIFISSPLHQTDMICRLFARSHVKFSSEYYIGKYTPLIEYNGHPIETDKHMLGFHYPTWELNPHQPIERYEDALRTDPENTLRDFAAIPSAAIEGFFSDRSKIDKIINESRPIPIDEQGNLMPYVQPKSRLAQYYLHVDPGAGRPSNFGICVAHLEEKTLTDGSKTSILYIDIAHTVPADPVLGEVDYEKVRKLLYDIIERFPGLIYSSDRWQDLEFRQKIRGRVKKVDTVVVKLEDYEELKRLIYEGRVDCHPQTRLVEELKRLELIGGKRVEKGLNFTKDTADCVAAVSRRALEKQVKKLVSGFNATGVLGRI